MTPIIGFCVSTSIILPVMVFCEYTEEHTMSKGTVKWFNNAKGFGFIERKDGEDVFVHYNQIRGDGYRSLSDGQQVEFSVTKTDKGFQAEDVDPA